MTGASDNSAPVGSVTILRTIGQRLATKTWKWCSALQQWSKISYQAGASFTADERVVRSLDDLVATLEDVRRDPRAFVVRGELTPEVRAAVKANPIHRIRRCKLKKNGVEPTLVEVPQPWIMIDVDRFPLLAWEDLAVNPDAVIDRAIHELLPEAFHDATCWWQLSASAGFVHGQLKAHLFFWLSGSVRNDHVRAVLKQHAPGIDTAPFGATQPHFIADPIIENGHDPLPRRTGWRKGLEAAVSLPMLRPEERRTRSGTGSFGIGGSIEAALAVLGDGEGLHGFHVPLRTATMHYAIQCRNEGGRDDEAFKDTLVAAIEAAPGCDERSYLDNNYLQRLIDGAFALLERDAFEPAPPRYKPADTDVEAARAELRQQVRDFFARTFAWHTTRAARSAADSIPNPEHAGMRVDVGVGKTTAVREGLPNYLDLMKGTELPDYVALMKGAELPHRVVYLVPTHVLGLQIVKNMQALGINAELWIGRGGDDPDTLNLPGAGRRRMCRELELVNEAIVTGHDPERHVCGSENGPQCPFRPECAYQRQKVRVAKADVVIAAHEYAFHDLPEVIREGVGLIIFDEAWWQDGLKPNQVVRLGGFAAVPTTWPVLRDPDAPRQPAGSAGFGRPKPQRKKRTGPLRQVADEFATAELHDLCLKVERALAPIAVGEFVTKQCLVAAGLTPADCERARQLEWRRKRLDVLRPGMAQEERKKALAEAEGNRAIPRRASLWRTLQALLEGDEPMTGRLQIGIESGPSGGGRVVLLHTRLEIRDWVLELPQLHLDATMPVDILRYYLPRLTVLADVRAKAPHMAVAQIVGPWGKTSLIPDSSAPAQENERRNAILGMLRDWVLLHAQGDGVVITYKDIERHFADLAGIQVLHFNALAGLDSFGQVRSLFIFGRPLPGPSALRDMALALTGKPVPYQEPVLETRGVLMDDGTGRGVPVRVYQDPTLELLRHAVTDAEIVQAIGRVRGVNRGPDNPVKVFLFADVIMPLPVSRLCQWQHVRLNVVERMAARGLVLESPRDAWMAYPDLFPNENAARQALARISVSSPYEKVTIGKTNGNRWLGVQYRPQGRGQQTRAAYVLADRALGLRAELEAWFGPLALFEFTEAPADAARHAEQQEPCAADVVFEADVPPAAPPQPEPAMDEVEMPTPAFADTPEPYSEPELVMPEVAASPDKRSEVRISWKLLAAGQPDRTGATTDGIRLDVRLHGWAARMQGGRRVGSEREKVDLSVLLPVRASTGRSGWRAWRT